MGRNIAHEIENEIDQKSLNLKCKSIKIQSINTWENNVCKKNLKKMSLIPTTHINDIFQELNDGTKHFRKFERNSINFKKNPHMLKSSEHEISSLENHIQNVNKTEKKFKKDKLNSILQRIKRANCSELNLEAHGWLMGIQEVKIPQDCKFKNIEDIELAKKRLLDLNESIMN